MNSSKLKKLQASGWKAGDAQRFLELSDEEALLVEINLSLADALKRAHKAPAVAN